MKNLFIIVSVILSIGSANAEIFGTAGTLRPGTFMLGVEPEFMFEPTEFEANFHIGYGLINKLDWDVRFAFGTPEVYFGSDLEYQFLRDSLLDFSVSVGAHYQAEFFLDITPNLSHRFRRFAVYTGLDMNWMLSGQSVLGLNWFLGTTIPIRRRIDVVFDFGINVKDYYHWISGGVAAYF
ncbi:MAG: hypothetical protein JXA66_06025 [Oligoflexia bacterium]|nr:hypothetical protein [Oligoflexia bacterium]